MFSGESASISHVEELPRYLGTFHSSDLQCSRVLPFACIASLQFTIRKSRLESTDRSSGYFVSGCELAIFAKGHLRLSCEFVVVRQPFL